MAAAACLALASLGQTTAPSPIAHEVDRLRAENEALRNEVASLKAKLAASPASTQSAKKETIRTFTTMMDVLANVPADLRPQAKAEWYKFQEAKFKLWVSEQMVGMVVDSWMHYSAGPTSPNVCPLPGKEFVIYGGSFGGKHFTYFGADHAWTVRYPTMYFDEAGARKWDTIKRGALMKVKGVIASVSVSGMNYDHRKLPSYTFTFELRDLEVIPPK
jgi:hypothetical protein